MAVIWWYYFKSRNLKQEAACLAPQVLRIQRQSCCATQPLLFTSSKCMFFAMLIYFETLSEITKILLSCLFTSTVTGLVCLWPKVAEVVANNKKTCPNGFVSELAKRSPHRCNVRLSLRTISRKTKFRQCSEPSLNLHLHIVKQVCMALSISNSKQTDGGRHFSALSEMPNWRETSEAAFCTL